MNEKYNILIHNYKWVNPFLRDVIKMAEELNCDNTAHFYRELLMNFNKDKNVFAYVNRVAESICNVSDYYTTIFVQKWYNGLSNDEIGAKFEIQDYVDRDVNRVIEKFCRKATVKYVKYGDDFIKDRNDAFERLRRYDLSAKIDISYLNTSVAFMREIQKYKDGDFSSILECFGNCDLNPLRNAGISLRNIYKLELILEEYKLVPCWCGELSKEKLTISLSAPYNILFSIGSINDLTVVAPSYKFFSLMSGMGVTRMSILYALANNLTNRECLIVRERFIYRKTQKQIAEVLGVSPSTVCKYESELLQKMRGDKAQADLMGKEARILGLNNFLELLRQKQTAVTAGEKTRYLEVEKNFLILMEALNETIPKFRRAYDL